MTTVDKIMALEHIGPLDNPCEELGRLNAVIELSVGLTNDEIIELAGRLQDGLGVA